MHYKVFLETSAEAIAEGGYLAHVPELVGCVARGATKDAALEKLRETIRAYHALARARNIPAPIESAPIELDVTETDATTFAPDYQPLTEDDLENFLRREEISRDELSALLAKLSPTTLNWRAQPDAWAIRNVLAHIAQADLWYASRLAQGGRAGTFVATRRHAQSRPERAGRTARRRARTENHARR